jgi:anthranilate synthase component 1
LLAVDEIGYLGYDLIRCYEDIGPELPDPYGLPLGHLAFCDTLLVFDHVKHTLKVVAHVRLDSDVEQEYRAAAGRIHDVLARLWQAPPLPAAEALLGDVPTSPLWVPIGTSNTTRERYEEIVREAKEYIAAGDIYQVVPSQRFSASTRASALAIYRALRVINPSPYMYLLDFGPYQLVGSSPELVVGVEDRVAVTRPIAGSRPRGSTPQEDARLAEELLADEKERAEHIMLVDLGRNDLGRVCQPGTVRVDDLMFIERYSHVMHIVSHVSGRLRPDLSPVDALRACFPMGTASGAPKIRAMQIISELEQEGRGPYAGAIGYFGYNGNLVAAITLRTLVLNDGLAHVQAGGGVVADSDPSREYEETVSKAQALLAALQLAEELTGQSAGRTPRPSVAGNSEPPAAPGGPG